MRGEISYPSAPLAYPLTIPSDGGVARSAGVGFDFPAQYHIYETARLKKGRHKRCPYILLFLFIPNSSKNEHFPNMLKTLLTNG